MFKSVREALDIQISQAKTLAGILIAMEKSIEGDPDRTAEMRERLEALELSNAKWQAECEATLMKAEGQFKAARNAEERTKTMVNHESTEGGAASEEEIFAAYRALGLGVSPGNAEAGEAEEVLEMREDVEMDLKAQALRMKFS